MKHGGITISKCVSGASSHNQDRATVIPVADSHLLVVSDGVGGMGGGAEAADAVLCFLSERAAEFAAMEESHAWALALAETDRVVLEDQQAGEATAVVACVKGSSVTGASVGDSRGWLVSEQSVLDLTEAQRRRPMLGSGAAIPTAFGPVSLVGHLVIGSDGLFNYTKRDEIVRILASTPLENAAARLVEAARLPTGELIDDVVVIVCARTAV
ncbi:hypothetical protein ACFL6M_04995 [Candidatus Eisenbacteria bacterium]|uniref:PPM-type phosphatase domain-containing protein n=1 Tax=Eiseniibacteriota bacterium TaxID=2212470 RepID=A0ABV6YKU6_UNCEI